MPAGLPAFVIGYHGTDRAVAEDLFAGRITDLVRSDNDYDWLGSGYYFWENSQARALDRARQFKGRKRRRGMITEPAVIGAVIDLGTCLNLLDHQAIQLIRDQHQLLLEESAENGTPLPKNENPPWMPGSPDRIWRRLDCLVIESIHAMVAQSPGGKAYDSVRAVFLEGEPAYPGAGFLDRSHIQICVRKPENIIGYFRPRHPA